VGGDEPHRAGDPAGGRHSAAVHAHGFRLRRGEEVRDDNGGALVSNFAYSGFVSLFPLLLVLVTILGLAASIDAGFRHEVLAAVANQVPLIGHQLTEKIHVLRRSSVIGLAVGLAGLIWGASGLAQAGLFTMEQVWNLPGPARPGYVRRLGRALEFLGMLAAGVVLTTLLASLNTYGHEAAIWVVAAELAAALRNLRTTGTARRGHPTRFPRLRATSRFDGDRAGKYASPCS
jgi:uncharacterized BrkB/YihY/UPF0761 family membrane protein